MDVGGAEDGMATGTDPQAPNVVALLNYDDLGPGIACLDGSDETGATGTDNHHVGLHVPGLRDR